MLAIKKNANLKSYNTFGLSVNATELAECSSLDDLIEVINLLNTDPKPYLVIGGGSNLLFSKDFKGLIIHPTIKGIEIIEEDDNHVWIKAGAGEEWDDLVAYCVMNNYYGLENLSYIPGNVGASPVQNIGAYGVEVKDCIEIVNGVFIKDGKLFTMNNVDCKFDYRYSVFKGELKNKVIVSSVVFKLKKSAKLNLSYGPVKEEVMKKGTADLQTLRETIIDIRKSKLPEPSEMGNAGSFFKNPIIQRSKFEELIKVFPQMPHYIISDDLVKIPAGWLIDTSGWKGKSIGGAAVHEKQALVLINKNNALAQDIINLSNTIISDIRNRFQISLEPEVNII
ncbi:UDP-N-acetylmuramate dehydrogenase [Carboxylicivirga linearis]|uniref:UDP-N-acetylenolpyruvoylglucosamine reductase n=1 Tax=Carboxylicivirga linearis TaxID=1628157 RepID=A0ABS5JUM6_9BACT|nr:UDP-N-acetylmuramate dehydrogenase [Carboxylicivirga linearis]MBS2098602.1 UDP-N-acetylmuramate dehydrogenase [Carboxylicivirga linearis]